MIALGVLLVVALLLGISGADLYVENQNPDDLADMGVVIRH